VIHDLATCEAIAAALTGQGNVVLSQELDAGAGIQMAIHVVAVDNTATPNVIHRKTVSAD
jgi:hypothetical protein